MPQTWVAKSGRQVHQWVPFFSKTWYFDGSIFQSFLKFAPKWRKFGTLIGQLFQNFPKFAPKWRKFQRKILIFGTWMGHFSFKMGTWMGGISKIPAAHPYPDQSWVPPPVLTIYSFCKIIFLSLKKPRFRTYSASKDVIGAFHNVLLMKTPVFLSNALLSKATRWQKLHSYWLAKATRCFLKQRVVATRNDPFGLPYSRAPGLDPGIFNRGRKHIFKEETQRHLGAHTQAPCFCKNKGGFLFKSAPGLVAHKCQYPSFASHGYCIL